MRLKTRLDRLETTNVESITRQEQMLLVSILGRRDALFWPWRFTINDRTPHAEIRRRQREYLDGSIGVAVKADGRADWKNAHAMRQSLMAGGFIAATHSSGQVQSVFLTALGEAYARALVGDRLHTVTSMEPIFIYLVLRSKQTKCNVVRESVLFNRDCTGDPTEWNWATELLLPFLTCGMVSCCSDTEGRACYTPKPVDSPEVVTVNVDSHDDFDDAYVDAFDAERQVLSTTEPRDPHELFIPLPATGWGWPVHFEESTNEQK